MNKQIDDTPLLLQPNYMVTITIPVILIIGAFLLNSFSSGRSSSNDVYQENIGSVTMSQAQAFMQDRCNNIGQTLMRSKTVDFQGKTLYLFMSVAENGMVCISTISELKLEVIASDCGTSDRKIYEWNNL